MLYACHFNDHVQDSSSASRFIHSLRVCFKFNSQLTDPADIIVSDIVCSVHVRVNYYCKYINACEICVSSCYHGDWFM